MIRLDKNNVLTVENPYLDELKKHYGDKLDLNNVSVMYFSLVGDYEDENYQFYTVVFIIKFGVQIDYVRVFGIGDRCTLAIDLHIKDITEIEELKKVVKYGTNFRHWHFEDVNLYDD